MEIGYFRPNAKSRQLNVFLKTALSDQLETANAGKITAQVFYPELKSRMYQQISFRSTVIKSRADHGSYVAARVLAFWRKCIR